MTRSLLTAVLLTLAVPARAYDWQFEQVDTVGNWFSPSLKLSRTGVLHFCYGVQEPGNRVVHSYFDSAWHREEIVPPDTLGGYAMDAGPHGEFGLVLHLSSGYWLYERQDTSWRRDSIPVPLGHCRFDSAGAPSGVFRVGDTILYARRAESAWISEPVAGAPVAHSYDLGGLIYTVKGEPCAVVYDFDYGYMYKYVLLYIEQADTWRQYYAASGGRRTTLGYVGCAPDTGGGAAVLYNYKDEVQPTWFVLSGYGAVDSGASAGAVAVHESGVPHAVYIRNQLRYACRVGNTWNHDTVFAGPNVQLAGIILEDSLPVIGFVDPATGVWLARRLPAGVQETPMTTVKTVNALPTIVRGLLLLPEAANRKPQVASLLDIMGRKVLGLRPGANNVRELAPGVYFVRAAQAQAQGQAVRKVIITR
jgi:hypothetical protein